jgi:hypothetical protein
MMHGFLAAAAQQQSKSKQIKATKQTKQIKACGNTSRRELNSHVAGRPSCYVKEPNKKPNLHCHINRIQQR